MSIRARTSEARDVHHWSPCTFFVRWVMTVGVSISPAEVLDRVVASIGDFAITLSDVEREYRLERLLDGQWPPPPPDRKTLEQVRERLTYQDLLLDQECQDLSHEATLEKTVADEVDGVRKRFPSEQAYLSALHSLPMDENQFTGSACRPTEDLKDHRTAIVAGGRAGNGRRCIVLSRRVYARIPRDARPSRASFVGSDGQIQEILMQKKIDQLLATWLDELSQVGGYGFTHSEGDVVSRRNTNATEPIKQPSVSMNLTPHLARYARHPLPRERSSFKFAGGTRRAAHASSACRSICRSIFGSRSLLSARWRCWPWADCCHEHLLVSPRLGTPPDRGTRGHNRWAC